MEAAERSLPTQPRSQERVEKIVRATQKMLAQHGYEETTIKRIAEAAGIKQTSIYRYYPNKRAVISVLADIFINEQNKAITHCIEESLRGESPKKILSDFIALLRMAMGQEPWIAPWPWIAPAQLALRSDPKLRDRHEEVLDHFAERFSLLLSGFGATVEGEALLRVSRTLVLILDGYMLAIGRAPETKHLNIQEDFEQVINSYLALYITSKSHSS